MSRATSPSRPNRKSASCSRSAKKSAIGIQGLPKCNFARSVNAIQRAGNRLDGFRIGTKFIAASRKGIDIDDELQALNEGQATFVAPQQRRGSPILEDERHQREWVSAVFLAFDVFGDLPVEGVSKFDPLPIAHVFAEQEHERVGRVDLLLQILQPALTTQVRVGTKINFGYALKFPQRRRQCLRLGLIVKRKGQKEFHGRLTTSPPCEAMVS